MSRSTQPMAVLLLVIVAMAGLLQHCDALLAPKTCKMKVTNHLSVGVTVDLAVVGLKLVEKHVLPGAVSTIQLVLPVTLHFKRADGVPLVVKVSHAGHGRRLLQESPDVDAEVDESGVNVIFPAGLPVSNINVSSED
jgi:hypothetical protein